MKKYLNVLLALVTVALLVCASIPATAASSSEFDVVVTANMGKANRGDTVTFTVAVENITAAGGLLSVDIPFRFDTGVFEFVSKAAVFPSVWKNPQDFGYTTDKSGLLWLRSVEDSNLFSSAAGCTESRAICFTVVLRVKDNAKLGETVITTNGDGVFEVACGTCADGQCTVASGTGESFSFKITDDTAILGDVNGDGEVDNADAAVILQYDAGIIDLSGNQLAAADVNGDGEVDNADAAMILKYDAGIIGGF